MELARRVRDEHGDEPEKARKCSETRQEAKQEKKEKKERKGKKRKKRKGNGQKKKEAGKENGQPTTARDNEKRQKNKLFRMQAAQPQLMHKYKKAQRPTVSLRETCEGRVDEEQQRRGRARLFGCTREKLFFGLTEKINWAGQTGSMGQVRRSCALARGNRKEGARSATARPGKNG